MRKRSMFAAAATTTALAVGLVAPATGGAAKVRSKSRAAASGDLTTLCKAIGLDKLLAGLEVDLSPLVRIKLTKVCE